ncbi:MAG: hypothetical protein KI790_08960 [Cyclobacteriaceae bacterium]|nr:hypothetical protein [Cyclobacteriaceae bacterium HetDA_MAG_MS6]
MNELKELWITSQMNLQHEVIDMRSLRSLTQRRSTSPISRLRGLILIKGICSFVLAILMLVMLPLAIVPVSQSLVIVLIGAYFITSITSLRLYLGAVRQETFSNLGQSLQMYSLQLRKILTWENRIGIFLYPISIAAGFLIGAKLGNPQWQSMSRSFDWSFLISMTIVLIPITHWVGRRWERRTLGNYLDRLEENIKALNNVDSHEV